MIDIIKLRNAMQWLIIIGELVLGLLIIFMDLPIEVEAAIVFLALVYIALKHGVNYIE